MNIEMLFFTDTFRSIGLFDEYIVLWRVMPLMRVCFGVGGRHVSNMIDRFNACA